MIDNNFIKFEYESRYWEDKYVYLMLRDAEFPGYVTLSEEQMSHMEKSWAQYIERNRPSWLPEEEA